MDQILPLLYLGNYRDAIRAIDNKSVDCIINVSRKSYATPKIGIFCHHIAIQDINDTSTIPYQKIALDLLITSIINNQKTLIHCAKGVSRSATIVILYLMKINNWPYQAALNFVKSKRSCINPTKFTNSISYISQQF